MEKYNDILKALQNSTSSGLFSNQVALSIYTPIALIIKIIFILLLMYISRKIGNALIDRSVKRQRKLKFSLDERKAKTAGTILKSILKYTVYIIGIIGIINEIFGVIFGRGIGLAFGSIIGVAVGLGAQNIIKDIINGIFILFEDQFAVGDYIDIENKSGIVESVEIRVTKLRDFNGDLHIIPNGLINKVTNHSRGNARILIDVEISKEEDVNKVLDIISSICLSFQKNDNVVEGPRVLGITDINENSVKIRVYGRVKPLTQSDVEMELRKQIICKLQQSKIRSPYQRIMVIKEDKDAKDI